MISSVQGTTEGVATKVVEGQEIIGTAQALVTTVSSSDIIKTAQAGATKIGESGLLETAKAFATKDAPALKATLESLATERGPELLGTMEAFATSQGPSLAETARAMSTMIPSVSGNVPKDVPIIEDGKENLTGGDRIIYYTTRQNLESSIEFYKHEMKKMGWELDTNKTSIKPQSAVLSFKKNSRKAVVTLMASPSNANTIIIILLQG